MGANALFCLILCHQMPKIIFLFFWKLFVLKFLRFSVISHMLQNILVLWRRTHTTSTNVTDLFKLWCSELENWKKFWIEFNYFFFYLSHFNHFDLKIFRFALCFRSFISVMTCLYGGIFSDKVQRCVGEGGLIRTDVSLKISLNTEHWNQRHIQWQISIKMSFSKNQK